MGCRHVNPKCRRRASPRRLRARVCLRKDCGRRYQPRSWNQRYCQEADCLREVHRWQAARRQAKRRQDEAAKAEHAEAQRARRKRSQSSIQPPKTPEDVAARGHAAKILSPRSVCARPGCHEPVPKSIDNSARYCCPTCRQAVRRVMDRERKWLLRGTFQGRRAREREYHAARARRCAQQSTTPGSLPAQPPPA